MQVRIAGIVEESFVDGPGIRFTIFTQGCPHKCKGCHNPKTHDYLGGYLLSSEDIIKKIEAAEYIDGITLSGGEPLIQAKELYDIALYAKKRGLNIWVYTGYTFEEIMENGDKDVLSLLAVSDVLVDGRFEIELRSVELNFCGSKNQRLLNLKQSLMQKKAIEQEL